MSLRPIDLQINFVRETDARAQRAREGQGELGAQRYAAEIEAEKARRDEAVRNLEESALRTVDEERERGGGGGGGGRRRKRPAGEAGAGATEPPEAPSLDPTRGSIIDVRFV